MEGRWKRINRGETSKKWVEARGEREGSGGRKDKAGGTTFKVLRADVLHSSFQ